METKRAGIVFVGEFTGIGKETYPLTIPGLFTTKYTKEIYQNLGHPWSMGSHLTARRPHTFYHKEGRLAGLHRIACDRLQRIPNYII